LESARAKSGDASLTARIALAIGATLVFLVLMELGARLVEWVAPPDARLLEASRPKETELPEWIPGAYRIFLYGGSTVYGAPVPEFSFAAQLEFWLHRLAPERPVQIVNFGVNGRPSAFVLEEIERTLPAHPDLAIVLTAHNEFLGWKPDTPWERRRQRVGRLLQGTALARTMRRVGGRLSQLLPGDIPIRRPLWISPEDREGERYRARVEGYRRNTLAITERARAAGVPLILATGPANLADWPPVYHFLHDPDYGRRVEALRDRIARGELDEAERLLAALREAYPGDAMLTWLGGRIAAARALYPAAAMQFDVARDTDPIPWRVLGIFNDHVRRLARAEGVFLADVDRAFREQAENGLVGFDLIADNCHPTPFGSALLARTLLHVMARQGLLLRDLVGLPALDRQSEVYREQVLDRQPDLPIEYLLTNAVYVMKWPFYDFDAARDYLEQARALAPQDWRIPANLGTVEVLEGHLEAGRRELDRAAELYGRELRGNDRGPTPYLREAQAILSGELEAFVPPETG
jgi:hypothetical protein